MNANGLQTLDVGQQREDNLKFTVVPNLRYACPRGYVRNLKGYAKFKSYMNNINFKETFKRVRKFLYVWVHGSLFEKPLITRNDEMTKLFPHFFHSIFEKGQNVRNM